MKKDYLVVFEKGETSFGAFAPDIPGCFAVGSSLEETKSRYLDAVAAHLAWMERDHDPIPDPTTTVFDFSRENGAASSSYYVEWLAIPLPTETPYAISA